MKMNLQFFGGRGSSSSAGGSGGGMTATALPPAPSIPVAVNANNAVFSAVDQQNYHDLYNGRGYFQKQNLTIDQQIATINYLSANPEPGSMYSVSQNMNYALSTGQPLNANQQYVANQLDSAMHNLGYNLNLHRYDHGAYADNLLKSVGLTKGYNNYSETQLKKALVGTTFSENKFLSTSYNNFANAPASSKKVFDSRNVKITYKAKASTQAYMPGNGPGGALGEIVVGRNTQQKIVDVKYTGKMSRKQGTQSYTMPQVEIVVELG